jgi:hypothetical protein
MREIRKTEDQAMQELDALSANESIEYIQAYLLDLLALGFHLGLRGYTTEQLALLLNICDELSNSGDELLDYVVDTGTPNLRANDGSTITHSVRKALEGFKVNISTMLSYSQRQS